ncbi:MAG: ATP-binding protein [Kiritimatiellae bacterium]|nr:ATP-binding protein [Kiritimatiellia bacterium]
MKNYKSRIFDALLRDALDTKGAVLIEGAKWCGKTTTAEQIAKSVVYMNNPKFRDQYLMTAQTNPPRRLEGEYPRLIDEWQTAPELWDVIRFDVDHSDSDGKYILTGSAVPLDDEEKKKIRHSGTGRFAWVRMRPMSLFESQESSGSVSFAELFAGKKSIGDAMPHTLEELAYLTCRGGWPKATCKTGRAALRQAFDYVDAVVNTDISRVDDVLRDPGLAHRIMKSLARLQGTQSSVGAIKADMAPNATRGGVHENTIYSYIGALKKIFVVEDMQAWCPNLRCKTPVRTTDTRYFTDPSIATAALGLGPGDLMNDLKTFGLFFETLVARDLRTYAAANDGKVSHYRDKSGLECDAVMHLRNGRYGLIEVKIGGSALIAEGRRRLQDLAGEIDTKKMPVPSFMMIVVAEGDYAYEDTDGTLICPVGCLRP